MSSQANANTRYGGLLKVLLIFVGVLVCAALFGWYLLLVKKPHFEGQLYEAVKTDDLESFIFYQKLGSDWRALTEDFKDHTMVTWVAHNGAVQIFNHLFADGYDIEFVNRFGHTPLFVAAQRGHDEFACALLDAGAQPIRDYNFRDPENEDWIVLKDQHVIHLAAESGLLGVCRKLVQMNFDVDTENRVGLTPLCYAAVQGHTELVNALLELGADADHSSSPLKFAITRGHFEVAELLVENGADPNIEGDKFHRLLSEAEANGAGYYARYSDLGFEKPWMKHPLTMAVESKNVALVELLLRHGADVHYATERGNTALHLAAYLETQDIIELLLRYGAEKEVFNERDLTPYGVAFARNRNDLGELIREYKDVNQLDFSKE